VQDDKGISYLRTAGDGQGCQMVSTNQYQNILCFCVLVAIFIYSITPIFKHAEKPHM